MVYKKTLKLFMIKTVTAKRSMQGKGKDKGHPITGHEGWGTEVQL
jgi:hypothetical protein